MAHVSEAPEWTYEYRDLKDIRMARWVVVPQEQQEGVANRENDGQEEEQSHIGSQALSQSDMVRKRRHSRVSSQRPPTPSASAVVARALPQLVFDATLPTDDDRCPQCNVVFNESNYRKVTESCGHSKCCSCFIFSEDGCTLCNPAATTNSIRNSSSTSSPHSSLSNDTGRESASSVYPDSADSEDSCFRVASSDSEFPVADLTSTNLDADSSKSQKRLGKLEEPSLQNNDNSAGAPSTSHLSLSPPSESKLATVTSEVPAKSPAASGEKRQARGYSKQEANDDVANKISPPSEEPAPSCSSSFIASTAASSSSLKGPQSESTSEVVQDERVCRFETDPTDESHDNTDEHEDMSMNDETVDGEGGDKTGDGENGEGPVPKKKKKPSPKFLHDHITILDGNPLLYQCNVCQKKFKTKANTKYHKFCGKSGDKPFKCEQCGQGFIAKSHYECHVRTHTGERPYVCPKCGKGFNQRGRVTRHMRSHSGEKPFVCQECNRGFALAQALKSHSRIHTGERPYACTICNKRFTQMTNLKKHATTHTRERPFSCDHCGRSFSTKCSLVVHLRTHSSERPHACDQCSWTFSTSSDLRRHLGTHSGSGERPFKCRVCGTAFRRKDNLDRHIRTRHNQSKEETAAE